MTTTIASILAAVAQLSVLLQQEMTQREIYQEILSDGLLASSLYVNIALAGLSILVFVFMARGVEDPRAKLIVVSVLLVPVVSISSYTGLLSGLTISVLEMPPGHALAGQEVISLWGRYITWAFSTPMILIGLGLLAGSNITKIFTAVTFDIAMCITGLTAALTTSSHLLRWWWYVLSCAFFGVVLYILLVEWPADAQAAGTIGIFNTLKLLTVVMWLGYPIFWFLGNEGIAVLSVGITSWAYSALDIIAKYLFAFLVINYVVDEPASVTSGASYGATVPADD